MTNMQLAVSELLEKRRHSLADEDIQRTRNAISRETNALNKEIAYLNAQVKEKEFLTNADVNRLRIATDKAIAQAKLNLSREELDNLKKKTAAEIDKLAANTAESLQAAERSKQLTPAEESKLRAEATYRNAKALNGVSSLIGYVTSRAIELGDSPTGKAVSKAKSDAAVKLATKAIEARSKAKKAVENTVKKKVKDKIKTLTDSSTNRGGNE